MDSNKTTQLKHLNYYFHVVLQSLFKLKDGHYPSASKLAMVGFILTLLNIIFTLLVGVLATSLIFPAVYPTECSTLYSSCYDPDGKTQYCLEGCVMSNIINHQNLLLFFFFFFFLKICFKVV